MVGLCIATALGIMRFLAIFGPVSLFRAQPVIVADRSGDRHRLQVVHREPVPAKRSPKS